MEQKRDTYRKEELKSEWFDEKTKETLVGIYKGSGERMWHIWKKKSIPISQNQNCLSKLNLKALVFIYYSFLGPWKRTWPLPDFELQ